MTAGWTASYWWQNANTLEALANLVLELPPTSSDLDELVSQMLPVFDVVFNATSNLTVGNANIGVNLTLSGYFDDTLWWGLGWLKAYKAVGDERYLERAEIIFNDIAVRAWDTNSCLGGVAWAFNNRYKNAITNELFLSLAAELALTTGNASYVRWARAEWDWLESSGIINEGSLVDDGLDKFIGHEDVCLNNGGRPGGEQWTYNHGVILSGLARLSQLTGETSLLDKALRIANAAVRSFTTFEADGGLLIEESVCEVPIEDTPMSTLYDMIDKGYGCNIDQLAFKGIFVRHLSYLIEAVDNDDDDEEAEDDVVGDSSFSDPGPGGIASGHREPADTELLRRVIAFNAESIWTRAACLPPSAAVGVGAAIEVPALFGFKWAGPCAQELNGPSATTQTAALDVLTAAVRLACSGGRGAARSE